MSYPIIDNICQQLEHPLSAAEIHGIASAMLCCSEDAQGIHWLTEISGQNPAIIDEEREILLALFEQTRQIFSNDEITFELFLPDEESALSEQAAALKDWCQGFVYGIGLSYDEQALPSENQEILKDIIEFSKMETEVEGDEDENALVEILEYLKVSILLFKEMLQDETTEQPKSLH